LAGFDGEVAPDAAAAATCRTSNSHVQFLSTEKINQTYPDAPKDTKKSQRREDESIMHSV
jgi:hypothetical protein